MEWLGIVSGMVAALVLGFELARVAHKPTHITLPTADAITRVQLEAELQAFRLTMDDWEEKMHLLYDRARKRVESAPGKPQEPVQTVTKPSSIPPHAGNGPVVNISELSPNERARVKARRAGFLPARP